MKKLKVRKCRCGKEWTDTGALPEEPGKDPNTCYFCRLKAKAIQDSLDDSQ